MITASEFRAQLLALDTFGDVSPSAERRDRYRAAVREIESACEANPELLPIAQRLWTWKALNGPTAAGDPRPLETALANGYGVAEKVEIAKLRADKRAAREAEESARRARIAEWRAKDSARFAEIMKGIRARMAAQE